jgi:hypothetical protein
VNNQLPLRAIDYAFTQHMCKLFEDYCEDVKQSLRDKRDADHARNQFKTKYGYATTAYREMVRYVESQK